MSEHKEGQATPDEACKQLQESKKTLLLSTLSAEGFPEISYAPYVKDKQGSFYIFISELAAHTQSLLANNECSVMFITDEEQSQNLFARERLIFSCLSERVDNQEDAYQSMLDDLEEKFGNVVGMLRSLPDFHLFRLKPQQGRYVVGFGKAYVVDPSSGSLEHISEKTLKESKPN
ncbi:HugZ family protein [Neptuniibacter sp. QD48_11]|uniref:HugZ family pyridoxamine 5'-phosphate oxidase n=1 Tax=unclassified Neptuniibacter TaxID=2630693 RepID=UPI0039F4A8D6